MRRTRCGVLVLAAFASAAFAQPSRAPSTNPPATPVWRSSIGTKFQPLTLNEAVAKANKETKLVVAYVHKGPAPDADKTFANLTLGSYLGWRTIPINVDALEHPEIIQQLNLSPCVQQTAVLLQPTSDTAFQVIELIDPAPTPGFHAETSPTAVRLLFRIDFARDRLAARDPAWGYASDRANPMPDAPPPEDPLHQVEDQTALAIADPGPDDRGWRGPSKADTPPAAPGQAPYDLMERLTEARAAAADGRLRLATGLYTWLWERSEELDPASRAFRRCILPLELRTLAAREPNARKRFGDVRDQLSRRLVYIGFDDLMTWFTLNEVCGDDAENVSYLDLYQNSVDEATMMPRGHFHAYRLIGARDKFIDPWRVDRPSRPGSRSAMPGDADGAALAHVRAVARRLGEPRKPSIPDDEFAALQTFRRGYLIDETARLHVALLIAGRDDLAQTAVEIAITALPQAPDRGQLLNSTVFCALATDRAAPLHAGYLKDAAALGYPNMTLTLRLHETLEAVRDQGLKSIPPSDSFRPTPR